MYTKDTNTIVTVGDLLVFKELVECSWAGDKAAQYVLSQIKQIVYGD